MKTKQLFYAFIFFIGLSAAAQQAPFMVCNPSGTTCAPYNDLTSAYNAAASGDYIYLPAGDFTLDSWISKEVHFIGAGFDINASITTGITRISGDIILGGVSANGSSFEGFYLTGNFRNYGNVSNITLSYLNFNHAVYYAVYNIWSWSNCVVKNCVVRDYLHFGDDYYPTLGENNLVMNSIVGSIYNTNHSTIKNCIISKYNATNYCFDNIKNSVIKNNIIGGQGVNSTGTSIDNVMFLNNATTAASGELMNGKPFCNEVNNSYGITAADTFMTATAFTYDLTFDYHIKATSPAHNGGDNGADMGIYGGSTPWKEGAIPSNPHIFFKNISNATDGSGNLPVQIKVSSQY